ncbi:Neutral zinc metallopeptidase, partial [Globisporangium splendens]
MAASRSGRGAARELDRVPPECAQDGAAPAHEAAGQARAARDVHPNAYAALLSMSIIRLCRLMLLLCDAVGRSARRDVGRVPVPHESAFRADHGENAGRRAHQRRRMRNGHEGSERRDHEGDAREERSAVSRLVTVSEHLFPREYDWRITVVDDPMQANACCYPGGKIVIYTGILDVIDYAVERGICKSKHDALAVILSHEIGHALARHTAESMSYLPLLYLQAILGMESPLLQYVFKFAFDLPFSRKQETEADHIGLMLMASACYDPTEGPRLWRAFGRFHAMLANDGKDDDDYSNFELDFYSTHPSNYKRERRLELLVEDALELQKQSSWCFSLKEKVQQLVLNRDTEHEFFKRINVFRMQQRTLQRKTTLGTIHELENAEVFKVLRDEQEKMIAQTETPP